MIIGITGTLAAGKGTVVEFLKSKGFIHYSVRDFLIEEIKKRNLPIDRDSMLFVANDLRMKNSPGYIVEQIYEKVKNLGENCIIESLRTPGEISSLKNKQDFILFSIDADIKLRYERAISRGGEKDKITFEKFVKQEEKETQSEDPADSNVKKCMRMADYAFDNNGTIEELEKKLEIVLKNILGKQDHSSGRKNYISWDEYFMGVALLSAQRSKDPSTQVGACIVDQDKKIVGTGYNGAPRGVDDKNFPWEREGDFINTKYAYVCHSELNAILNSTTESLKNCTMYVGLFPCNECAKAIIQSGIRKVVYLSDKYHNEPAFIVGRKLLNMAGIEMVELKTNMNEIKLNFEDVKNGKNKN